MRCSENAISRSELYDCAIVTATKNCSMRFMAESAYVDDPRYLRARKWLDDWLDEVIGCNVGVFDGVRRLGCVEVADWRIGSYDASCGAGRGVNSR